VIFEGKRTVEKRRLKIGMIGAGFIGQLAHLMNLVEVTDCRVVALAEFRPELRRRVASRYEIPRAYATHHELLRDADVEAVVVVTPRPYTAPVTLDCLNAGKHVLTEKPMAGTLAQAKRLVETARTRNLHYVIGYMKRFDGGVQKAKKILDELLTSNELGPVVFVRAHCFMGDSYCKADGHIVTSEQPAYGDQGWPIAPDDFPAQMARDYAFYLNTYSHNTNLLRYLFGRTPNVDYVRFDQQAGRLAVLNFGSFIASLETGRVSNRGWDEHTEIFFADGRLTIRTPPALLKNVPAQIELYKAGTVQEICLPQCDWSWAFRRQSQAFVTDVLENRESLNSAADALEDMRLIEQMWRLHSNAARAGTGK
jgi:predicted dehydrogenase